MSKKTKHETMAQAVAAAQAEMSNAIKDSSNPHFKTTFASLAAIRDIVIPAFSAHGVAVVQEVIGMDGHAGVRTTLYWQGSPDTPRESMPAGDLMTAIGGGRNASQDCGSAATYYRRYQLAACAGIAQEDDDAESAPVRPTRPQPSTRAPDTTGRPKARANAATVDSKWSTGDTVTTSKGNTGTIFWIGGDKGDSVGVRWGDGEEEKEWTYLRFLRAPPTGAPADAVPDDEIPF